MKRGTDWREGRRLGGWRSRRGTALIEFSLAASIMILLTLGVFQFGFVYFAVSDLNNAARDGARYGSVHPGDTNAIKTNIVRHLSFADNSLVQIGVTFPDGHPSGGRQRR